MKPMKGQMALFDERTPAKSRREGAAAKHAAPSRRLRADWRAARDFAADMVAETLYPTRCAAVSYTHLDVYKRQAMADMASTTPSG